jgi:hypothetical protein
MQLLQRFLLVVIADVQFAIGAAGNHSECVFTHGTMNPDFCACLLGGASTSRRHQRGRAAEFAPRIPPIDSAIAVRAMVLPHA